MYILIALRCSDLRLAPNFFIFMIDLLKTKYPDPAKESSLLDMCYLPKDGVVKAQDVIFENIDATAIYKAAKKTNGSAGPSGLDSDGSAALLQILWFCRNRPMRGRSTAD